MEPTTLFDTVPSDPSGDPTPLPPPARRRRRRETTALAAAIALASLLTGGIVVATRGGGGRGATVVATSTSTTGSSSTTAGTSTTESSDGSATTAASTGAATNDTSAPTAGGDDDGVVDDGPVPVDDDTPPDPAPEPEPQGGDADQPVDLGPGGDVPASLCDPAPADGANLVVGPDPLVLAPGKMSGTFVVGNCGLGAVGWGATTVPSVTLGTDDGELPAGESVQVPFTIDANAWEPGAVEFDITVQQADRVHVVHVHAFRPTLGKDLVAGNGSFTAGATAGGCANQCITKAAVKAAMSTPDIQLDIATDVDAFVKVWVSTTAPIVVNGTPSFPGVAPIASSPGKVRSWLAPLSPLQPATRYYVIVRAADANGKVSYRSGQFRTVTPAGNGTLTVPGGAPGCKAHCIVQAAITPGDEPTVKHLAMRTNVPTLLSVAVSTETPYELHGKPAFHDPLIALYSGEQYIDSWDLDLGPLELETEYHIIVTATDQKGNVSTRSGTFRTPDRTRYDVHFEIMQITVDDDNDAIGRGELTFAWGVGDDLVGIRGEQKLEDGDRTHFGANTSSYVVNGAVGFLPTVKVTGYERDADGLVEFCSMGYGARDDSGSNGDCDTTWNSATTGIVSVGPMDLPACSDLGVDPERAQGRRCLSFASPDSSKGPEFSVLMAIEMVARSAPH